MKKITVENYRGDKHYPRIVRATDVILARRGFVSPTELFVEMGLLRTEAIEPRESFAKDLKGVKEKGFLRRVQEIIEAIDKALGSTTTLQVVRTRA